MWRARRKVFCVEPVSDSAKCWCDLQGPSELWESTSAPRDLLLCYSFQICHLCPQRPQETAWSCAQCSGCPQEGGNSMANCRVVRGHWTPYLLYPHLKRQHHPNLGPPRDLISWLLLFLMELQKLCLSAIQCSFGPQCQPSTGIPLCSGRGKEGLPAMSSVISITLSRTHISSEVFSSDAPKRLQFNCFWMYSPVKQCKSFRHQTQAHSWLHPPQAAVLWNRGFQYSLPSETV